MKQKIIALLLAAAMLCSLSVTAMATEPDDGAVTITMTLSNGIDEDFFRDSESGAAIAMQELTVPYFDLALYGLDEYYYNENCYQNYQEAGTQETAEGNVTMLHALIYATEVFHCGYSAEAAGKGAIYDNGQMYDAGLFVEQEQQAGSFFLLNFWGVDTGGSLMYHINHEYPIGIEEMEWGSTMDQIKLTDGDHISFHVMGNYDGQSIVATSYGILEAEGERETWTVSQGETVDMNLTFVGSAALWTPISSRTEEVFEGVEVRCTEDNTTPYDEWRILGVTDESGMIHIDTTELAAGEYTIAVLVPFEDPAVYGASEAGVFEYAPAAFTLIVEGSAAPSVLYGDVNGDGLINAKDASKVLRHEVDLEMLSGDSLIAADVNGDGLINAKDASLILRYEVDLIDRFPVENQ